MSPELHDAIQEQIRVTIFATVNGKVDKMTERLNENIATVNNMRQEITTHNELHEHDMQRILPIIVNFEEAQNDLRVAKKAGRGVLWIAAMVTAIGGAALILLKLLGK